MAFLVAHGAGNDLVSLRRAEELDVRLVEADVRLFHGRLEVRHLKTLGPLPIFWDRWRLARPFAPRLVLADLLAAVAPRTELMLDLKGWSPRLARLVLAALPEGRPVTVCARSWRLLDAFRARPHTRIVHSVGSRRQLRAFLRRTEAGPVDALSIHARFLDERTVAELRRRAALLLTWPVNTAERARELAALGVDGLITDDVDAAMRVRAEAA